MSEPADAARPPTPDDKFVRTPVRGLGTIDDVETRGLSVRHRPLFTMLQPSQLDVEHRKVFGRKKPASRSAVVTPAPFERVGLHTGSGPCGCRFTASRASPARVDGVSSSPAQSYSERHDRPIGSRDEFRVVQVEEAVIGRCAERGLQRARLTCSPSLTAARFGTNLVDVDLSRRAPRRER